MCGGGLFGSEAYLAWIDFYTAISPSYDISCFVFFSGSELVMGNDGLPHRVYISAVSGQRL